MGELARKAGHTLACNPDAERLLTGGEVVGVWPEGFKGIGKPFADRYRLQRFGRGGFVSAALRTGTPIIPTAIVGAEEIYPKIGDIRPLARLLNARDNDKEARTLLEASAGRLEGLLQRDQRLGFVRMHLGQSCRELSQVLARLGEKDLADAAQRKAEAFGPERKPEPNGPRGRRDRK